MSRAATSFDDRVRTVVQAVVGRGALRPDEPLGLDSLGSVELVLALEEELGVQLPGPVPGTLGQAIEGCRAAGRGVPVPALAPGIGHLQWLARAAMDRLLRAYFRVRVEGDEGVPSEGPVILASNHDSLLDIPLLVIAAPRPVWFMAKRELFGSRRGAWLYHVLGGFPVDRVGPDVPAVRAGMEVLEAGRLLGMYPEGTRSPDFLPFRLGAAWLALESGAPIVPVGITGTAEAMPRGSTMPLRSRVRVRFGEPMRPGVEGDSRARLRRAREVTDELRAAVLALLT